MEIGFLVLMEFGARSYLEIILIINEEIEASVELGPECR